MLQEVPLSGTINRHEIFVNTHGCQTGKGEQETKRHEAEKKGSRNVRNKK